MFGAQKVVLTHVPDFLPPEINLSVLHTCVTGPVRHHKITASLVGPAVMKISYRMIAPGHAS
jgi:hypothetical protein